ncbi:MAG: aminotransferase class V-fold PLP-dependent enzyme [Candidatus Falkowbacteria bacterium]|nr:aminotransferase class V-fold PLP-dependent enzyme [Candidatus Falkowbacteria bacterium]
MKINENNEKRWRQARVGDRGKRPQKVLFHTDATQAIQFLNCDVSWNYLDLLTCSAHKIYGPKGVGALICKEGIELKPILKGGGQERGRRSGTLNVPGIVGLASAIQKLDSNFIKENNQKIAQLKNLIISELTEKLKNWHINGSVDNSIPAILNISFDGIDAESIMIALDMKGVAISTGSACATHKLNYSHVLHAMGVNEKNSRSAIRISLGKYNTEKEILDSVKILIEVIKKIVH